MQVQAKTESERVVFHSPDFGAAVLEKLEEFGDHDVERSVQSIAVQ